MIYQYHLGADQPLSVRLTGVVPVRLGVNILRTCRQIFEEAVDVVYRNQCMVMTVYIIRGPIGVFATLLQLPVSTMKLIQFVFLAVNITAETAVALSDMCLGALQKLKSLKCLTVTLTFVTGDSQSRWWTAFITTLQTLVAT